MRNYALLLILLILVACSDDEPNGPLAEVTQSTAPPPALATAQTNTVGETATTSPPGNTAIEMRDYILGPDDAFVTIIMYGDFQSARGARYARDLEILQGEYPADLRLIWRHLPDTQSNDNSALAFQASEAAAAQGRFWDMHAILFTTQAEWTGLSSEAFYGWLIDHAESAMLDVEAFQAALEDERYLSLIEQYQQQAEELGIVGNPTLLINGELLTDRDDLFGLNGAVQLALLAQRHFEEVPPMTIDTERDYKAVIVTDKGEIHMDLFETTAPITVNNFVFLAEQGWFDDTTFFLVNAGFYAQAGDPSETGRGNPGYFISSEHDNGLTFDRAGLVAMSHPPGELDQASSQFLITLSAISEWDSQYTIFGEVTDGMDVVESLTPRNLGDPLRFPNPPPGDYIQTVRIEVQ